MLALPAVLIAAAVATANASALQRLSAEFQNAASKSVGGEVSTNLPPLPPSDPAFPGGLVLYDKIISLPQAVAYITFSAQADTHLGSALLMSASIVDSAGAETVCQPMATAGGAAEIKFPWMTLLKLPAPTTSTNCKTGLGDGGGGSADCHDNTIMFSCCVLVAKPDRGGDDDEVKTGKTGSGGTTHHVKIRLDDEVKTTHHVKIRLADFPGGLTTGGEFINAFYENSTIYIDSGPNPGKGFCQAVGLGPH